MSGKRQIRAVLGTALTIVILAGCGQMPESVPPTPSDAPATAPATNGDAAPPDASPAANLTLGDLANRVNTAWADVASYQVVSSAEGVPLPPSPGTPVASPVASPVATPVDRERVAIVFTREVVLPDQQRQEVTGLGPNDHEAIVADGQLYLRGPLVEQIAPGTPEDAWIALDPAHIPAGSVLMRLLGGLPATPPAPMAMLPERLLPQEVREIETVEFDGRECRVYGAADTITTTGTRVDFTIAVDVQDHPCFIETSSGGVLQGRNEYRQIGGALAIEAPAATPVSVPPAMATPAVHD